MNNLTEKLVKAVQDSPNGIAELETLKSLQLCDSFTLRTTMSRLCKAGRLIRLKRGVYSANPINDAFMAAQRIYSGYIGFSSALYIHKLITEMPFTITVVTVYKSGTKRIGTYEFRAVALKEKAIGFENIGNLTVSTKAKTLFDCIYLGKYSIEKDKFAEAYGDAQLNTAELREFDSYVKRFATSRTRSKFESVRQRITKEV